VLGFPAAAATSAVPGPQMNHQPEVRQ